MPFIPWTQENLHVRRCLPNSFWNKFGNPRMASCSSPLVSVAIPLFRSKPFLNYVIQNIESIELAGPARLMHSTLVSGPKTLPVRYRFRS